MTENEAKEAATVTPTKSLFGGVSKPVEAAKDVDEKLVEASGPAEFEPIHANVDDVEREKNSLKRASEEAEAERVEATASSEDSVVERGDTSEVPDEAAAEAGREAIAEGEANRIEAETPVTDEAAPEASEDGLQVEPEASAEDTSNESVAVEEPATEQADEPVTEAVDSVETEPAKEAVSPEKPETMNELQSQKTKLDGKITKKQQEERNDIINQIAAIVKTYAIPVGELVAALGGVPSPRKGIPAPILYRDSNGNAWSGRGKTPKWLKDKNPADYKV